MTFTPTPEQVDILNAFNEHRVLKINACAGSGKSSTLKLLSEQHNQPSLYVCYNSSISKEAQSKFPQHVSCRTTHSLAYSMFGGMLQHKLKRQVGAGYINVAQSVSEIVKYYKISDLTACDSVDVPSRTIGSLVKATVGRFQNSADEAITLKNIPHKDFKEVLNTHPSIDKEILEQHILRYANLLWLDRINPHSVVIAEHDTYLKLWQLSNPKLPYDIIYSDESQDLSPVMFDVLRKQEHCKVVYVGDTYQSIYAFRQAVNAMQEIKAPTKQLSKSFRFGSDIADLATYIIDGVMHVKGLENISSKLTKVTEGKYTMIFRTNACLIDNAVKLIGENKKVRCEIDTRKFESLLRSVEALFCKDFKNVKDEDIALYGSWSELFESLDEEVEYKRLVNIVLSNQTQRYLTALLKLKKQGTDYDILLVTPNL